MRYKRTKIIETILFDGEVTDLAEIKEIVVSLNDHEFDIALRMKNEMIIHPRVRIVEIGDDSFKYAIIGKGSSLVKKARYADIESMSVTSNDLYTAQMKPGISRWNLINPASDFESGL